jgi:heterodisulfide reductase subunit A
MIVATGYDVFDHKRKPEYGYGRYPQVMTTLEMERKLAEGDPLKGTCGLTINGKTPKDIVFVKCVGSRDVQLGNPYCSRVCCMVSAKQARLLKEQLPDSRVTVFYMDVRTFGKRGEEFYDETRNAGVLYRRGNVAEIYRKGDRVAVRVEDTFLRRTLEHEADLVVLAVGMQAREDVTDVAELLSCLARRMASFSKRILLRPVDTAVDGVFLAALPGPKDIPTPSPRPRQRLFVAHPAHPGQSAGRIGHGDFRSRVVCAACGLCVDVCPFGAPSIDPVWNVSVVNAVLCKGCGTCAAMCPSKAIRLQHFTPEQILAQVDALVW